MSVAYRITDVPGLFSEGVESSADQTPLRLRAHRERLLGETLRARLARLTRVGLAMSSPRRLLNALAYLELMARDRAVGAAALPDPAAALPRPDGFCGAAADLSPSTLMQAYAQGLHARAPFGAASWWSPPLRRLRDLSAPCEHAPVADAVFDSQSDAVVAACALAALRRDPLCALTPDIKRAHARLLDRGFAHAWRVDGAQGYGVVIGGVFIVLGLAGEREAARRAILALERELRRRNFRTLDLTFVADAIGPVIGAPMKRADYLDMLAHSPNVDCAVRWR
jgi:leucyl/phenylalanyl-tRNA--protein transferase